MVLVHAEAVLFFRLLGDAAVNGSPPSTLRQKESLSFPLLHDNRSFEPS